MASIYGTLFSRDPTKIVDTREFDSCPELFTDFDETIHSLNQLWIKDAKEDSSEEFKQITSGMTKLVAYATNHFNHVSTWGLPEISKEWKDVAADSLQGTKWYQTKYSQPHAIPELIEKLIKLKEAVENQYKKKVEQTTVEQLTKRVSTLQEQVDQLTKNEKILETEVHRLRDVVKDVEGQLADKRAPSSSRK